MLENLDEVLNTTTLTWWELIAAGLILVVSILIARWVRHRVRSWLGGRPDVAPYLPELIGRLSGWAMTFFGIVTALVVLGIQLGPVVLVLLLIVAVVAMSARKLLENFSAGLSLQIEAPFTVGDRIETQGITGWVEQINSRAVVLTSRDRRTVHIPNAMVLDSILFNYTDDRSRRSEVAFSVAYGQDLGAVRTVTTRAVSDLSAVYNDPAPIAFIEELADDGVEFQMRFYHDDKDRITARDQAAEAIVNALRRADITMPTPELVIQKAHPTDAA